MTWTAHGRRRQRRRRTGTSRLRARQRRDSASLSGLADQPAAYRDAIDVMLNGVYYTIEAALPTLMAQDHGGAIVITSSTAGFKALSVKFDTKSHGAAGYGAAKHGVVGLMRYYATTLAAKNIRVNSVHPSVVDTPMIVNEAVAQYVSDRPELGAALANLFTGAAGRGHPISPRRWSISVAGRVATSPA